ncbi:DUF2911 domain-containing protein [Pelagicoccus albus]|uniref:DUF2911 domain-containing protein n=1 Tax=Pelagicoccus albus TaxID=415222 RepID=A0A7X1B2T6_9BACT|nr:DUF2911 domain-containing protein [Pelagicoccus albus]MBC2604527.1 DUF2911 domain-containing protein [Pelagicoccus albus]
MKLFPALPTLLISALLAVGSIPSANANLKTPAASPHASFKQTVGLTEVEMDYSRPGVKDREIFGELVPYGKVWRTGANQPSKIRFSDDVVFGGEKIPAGEYALYTIPGEAEWTVIVYGSTELWGAFGYEEKNDVVRFSVTPMTIDEQVESMSFGIKDLESDQAVLYLEWDYTCIEIPILVPTDKKVMSQIEKLKSSDSFDSPRTLFAAGTYYHETGKDLKTALKWVSSACEKSEKPAYWMLARKAQIEMDLGMTKEAKASAEKTLKLATEGGNPDYQKIAQDILESL